MSLSHDFHDDLPGYSPAQVFHDHCGECSRLADDTQLALEYLEGEDFTAAWQRCEDWAKGVLRDVSEAEVPLLRILWAVKFRQSMAESDARRRAQAAAVAA